MNALTLDMVTVFHDRAFASDDITKVTVHCVVETRDAEHISALHERLQREGFELAEMTNRQ